MVDIGDNDPQAIFWRQSDRAVPVYIEKQLTAMCGKDLYGDPVLRVRFDKSRFKEGCWVVEEKWSPAAFGTPFEWNQTKSVYIDGEKIDFGDFPNRGLYMGVMVWCDENGQSIEPNQEMIDRLNFQRQQRETKDISPEQVAYEVEDMMLRVERQQKERFEQAQKEIAEDQKSRIDLIAKMGTTAMGLPQGIISKNNSTDKKPIEAANSGWENNTI